MSTTTVSSISSTAFNLAASPRAGLLRRVVAAIVQSRAREAQPRLAVYLAAMGDQQLDGLGLSTADIESIGAGEPVGNILARRAGQM